MLEFQLALSHLLSRKRQTIISLLGICVGVAFFMAISGLMRGSEYDFMQRLVENAPHITVYDEYRTGRKQPLDIEEPSAIYQLRGIKPRIEINGIRHYKQSLKTIRAMDGLVAAGILQGQALVTFSGITNNITLTGVIPDELFLVSTLNRYFTAGSLLNLTENPQGVLIGQRMAEKLHISLNDKIFVSTSSLTNLMKVVGIFSTGNASFDEHQIYADLRVAQKLLQKPNIANRIIIKLTNPERAISVAGIIERLLGYKSQSWQEASEDLMNLVKIRNLIMYAVVGAILLVAGFGIYNVISTIVLEKTKDIAILKSIGFDSSEIQRIFVLEGLILGSIGCVLGSLLGYLMMYMLSQIAIKSPFYSAPTFMPVYWGIDQFIMGIGFAMSASLLAAWLPARKAGKLQPVDILRGQ